jgi:hypothetical protein
MSGGGGGGGGGAKLQTKGPLNNLQVFNHLNLAALYCTYTHMSDMIWNLVRLVSINNISEVIFLICFQIIRNNTILNIIQTTSGEM